MKEKMYKKCRCMGLSGSCNIKHCWTAMPDIRELTDTTFKRYESAIQINSKNEEQLWNTQNLAESLVYHHHADYCASANHSGRKCDPIKAGPGGCDYICCGKGHKKKNIRKKESIRESCVVQWDPYPSISCDQREITTTEYFCR